MHYVIGDVHGCYDELMKLIHKIQEKDSKAQYILIGDLIDRGPKTWEVLQWAVQNITLNGKYQCVRGNHEQLALEWYKMYQEWYDNGCQGIEPESQYDISAVLKEKIREAEQIDTLHSKEFEKIMKFFETLPYYQTLEVLNTAGVNVCYRIVHGWYDYGVGEHTAMQHHTNLWKRNYWGNRSSAEEIIVFGHTPTIESDFNLRGAGEDWPGMICYRENSINVDCGCVYGKNEYHYPCMLGAICLETLEEIYPWGFEERMTQLVCKNASFPKWCSCEQYAEAVIEGYREKCQNKKQEENRYRKRMMERFGFTKGVND